ncbi:MAG: hypothetical protein ABR905_10215 [Terracidiphilus sp.]|jgi:hypothetical protein
MVRIFDSAFLAIGWMVAPNAAAAGADPSVDGLIEGRRDGGLIASGFLPS